MAAIAGNDAQILAELHDMLEEIDWLFGDLANEIERRSPELGRRIDDGAGRIG